MDNTMTSGLPQPVTQRPRYYPRQLVTPAELNLEASYFVDRLRRHNQLMHGWGVICGALVCRVADTAGGAQPWMVRITPGHLIDPYGNEIAILAERVVDLRLDGVTVSEQDPAGELSDPWCSQVQTQPTAGPTWVAVKYYQSMARPVRTQPAGCSCDDSTCEYSRWCDGYQVGLLDQCPPSHQGPPPVLDTVGGGQTTIFCPPDPGDPWVVLARVDVDGDGRITAIDNCSCRRLIITMSHLWWRCTSSQPAITTVEAKVDGQTVTEVARGQAVAVHLVGTNIGSDATVDLGQGIQVTGPQVSNGGTTMDLTVTVLDSAQPGPRDLTISNSDRAIATSPGALTVSPQGTPGTIGMAGGRRPRQAP